MFSYGLGRFFGIKFSSFQNQRKSLRDKSVAKFFTVPVLKVKWNPDISHAEKLENSLLLLDNYYTENQTTTANLPSNIEVMKVLNVNLETGLDKSSNYNTVNE